MVGAELDKMFREAFDQTNVSDRESRGISGRPKIRKITSKNYSAFLEKYKNLDKYIESFKPMDLVYYFREKSRDTGNHYTIRNMKRDMGIFKKLLFDYTPVEVCAMIEFLFESPQNYLPTLDLQPTVLASTYCDHIYKDTLDWVEDKYVPTKHNKTKSYSSASKRNVEREYNGGSQVKCHKSKLGSWE